MFMTIWPVPEAATRVHERHKGASLYGSILLEAAFLKGVLMAELVDALP
jgi:hypothetical protein